MDNLMKIASIPNSDRTTPNRRNSAFRYCIAVKKSEKFRFLRVAFTLFLCCYCSIFNILIDISSSSKKIEQIVKLKTFLIAEKIFLKIGIIPILATALGQGAKTARRSSLAAVLCAPSSPSQLPARAGSGDPRPPAASSRWQGGYCLQMKGVF